MTLINKSQTGIDICFREGPCGNLLGRAFTIPHGSLTRINADGPSGQSLFLEALATLSIAVTEAVESIRWPAIDNSLLQKVDIQRMSPCVLAEQDRFFSSDSRDISDLFGFKGLLTDYLCEKKISPNCPICHGPIQAYPLSELTVRLLAGLEKGSLLLVSTLLDSPGPKLRKKWMSLGFHRFWIDGQLVDSEDIEVSGSWARVKAVLIDSLTAEDAAAGRFIEAALTAQKLGNGDLLLHHNHREWIIQTEHLFCASCCTTLRSDTFDQPLLSEPTIAELINWLDFAKTKDPAWQGEPARKTLVLLQLLKFDALKPSTRLSELPWYDQGLLLLLRAVHKGGPGRFILVDDPFRGLDPHRRSTLIDFIKESCGDGWGWIVTADGGALDGQADLELHFERFEPLTTGQSLEKSDKICSRLGEWRGRLSWSGGPELDVQSGQWLMPHLDDETWLKSGLGASSYETSFEDSGQVPMVRFAGHELAWKMAQGHRQTLAGLMRWDRMIADRLAQLSESRARGLDASKLLGRHALGQCVRCRGKGMLADMGAGRWCGPCPVCQGTGMRRTAGDPEYHQFSLYDIMRLTVRKFDEGFSFFTRLSYGTKAAVNLGFAGFELNRRIWTFSYSERWLLLLLSQMVQFSHRGLWIVDQPWLGLNGIQGRALDELFHQFIARGGSLVTFGSRWNEL